MQFWDWSIAAAQGSDKELHMFLKKYCMLTDDVVFSCIKFSPEPAVKTASDIIQAVERRSCKDCGFYKHIGVKILPHYISEVRK